MGEDRPSPARLIAQAFGQARQVVIGGDHYGDVIFQAPPVVPALYQLPSDIAEFTGREREVRALVTRACAEQAGAVAVSAVAGKPGVGKSALAVHVAHRLAARFGDAQLYVNLRGQDGAPSEPAEVLAGFVRALGVAAERVPGDLAGRQALYRSLLAGRRALVVLDNARDAAQVWPLLPGSPTCAVLVTSRSRLAALEGASRLDLRVMSAAEALRLFGRIAGAQLVDAEPQAAADIVELCGGLPLAVRIAGARAAAPGWSLSRLAERLADTRRGLEEFQVEDLEVRASFALSYADLAPAEARAFRLLGLRAGPDFAAGVVAALLGDEPEDAERLVERLVEAQLVEIAAQTPVRYRFHDLLRRFSRERLTDEPVGERDGARRRALDWYLTTAEEAAVALLNPQMLVETYGADPGSAYLQQDRDVALTLLEAERPSLIAAVDQAHDAGLWELTSELALALTGFFSLRGYWRDWQRTHELALEAARHDGDRRARAYLLAGLSLVYAKQRPMAACAASREDEHEQPAADGPFTSQGLRIKRDVGDRHGEAQALVNLGLVHHRLGRWDDAASCYDESLTVFRELQDRRGQAQTLGNLGVLYTDQGRTDEAARCCHEGMAVFRELGARQDEGRMLNNLGIAYADERRWDDAAACRQESVAVLRELGDRHGEAEALGSLGTLHREQGRWDEAIGCFQESLRIKREIDDRYGEGKTLNNLGLVYQQQGRWDDAAGCYHQCLEITREIGDRYGHAQTLINLGLLHQARGEVDQPRACWRQALVICDALGAPEAAALKAALRRLRPPQRWWRRRG